MTLYSQLFEDAKFNYPNIEDYAWGEELVDYKITIYKNDKTTIPNYSKIENNLIKVGLVTVNKKMAGMIVIVDALYDTVSEMIYMKEKTFNQKWKLLRKSIQIGINNSPESCEKNNIYRPEDILILSCFNKGASKAYVNSDGQIVHSMENNQPASMKLKASRQRMMDDPKLIYVYSVVGGHVHDKLCNEIANISDANFRASAEFPKGGIWCTKCRRTSIIRRCCSPLVKQIPFCDHIFKEYRVSLDILENMIAQGCKIYASDLKSLKVKGLEDNWEIRFTEEGPQLWHNNYVRTSETERYITDGFHKQSIRSKNVNTMFYYILNYTWEKHLEGEELKKAKLETVPEIKVVSKNEEKKNILRQIMDFIKSIVKRK